MPSTLISLRTLSDPTRARLMHILQGQELSVAEIQEILGMGQSRISTHLAQLKRAALVQDRRVGKNIYYSWNPTGPIKEAELTSLVRLAVADMPEATLDRSSLHHVIAKRKTVLGTISISSPANLDEVTVRADPGNRWHISF